MQKAIANIDAEVIVIDNNSPDDSCAMVKAKFPEIQLIENKENSGFSKGNNIGVAQAKGEYICILNPDTVVAEDTFIKLLNFANQTQNLGAIGCKLIDGSGRFLPESKRNVPVVRVAFQKMAGHSKNYYANHLKENETGKIEILVGAFMFMKRHVYNQVNGFDEDYFMYGEDIDLSYKLVKAGLDNYYFGDTTVIHYKGESTLKDKTYAKRFYGAMQTFYQKHFKSNIFFDAVVWFGIHFAKAFNREVHAKALKANHYFIFSLDSLKRFNTVFPFEFTLVNTIDAITPNTEVIFDANTLSYKAIIDYMVALQKNNTQTFKILPKNSNFIIGSNNAIHRGEILHF